MMFALSLFIFFFSTGSCVQFVILVCSSEWWLSLISHSLSCGQQNLKGPEDVLLTRLCICIHLPNRQGWAVCFLLWFIALEPFLFNSHEFSFITQSIFNHAALIKQNNIQLRCKANFRLTLILILQFEEAELIWSSFFLLIDFRMQWSRWRLCAVGAICTHQMSPSIFSSSFSPVVKALW